MPCRRLPPDFWSTVGCFFLLLLLFLFFCFEFEDEMPEGMVLEERGDPGRFLAILDGVVNPPSGRRGRRGYQLPGDAGVDVACEA